MAIVLLTMAMPLFLLLSCKKDIKDTVEYVFNPETSYTLKEKNTETLIFDSTGVLNKVIAETFLMFDKASNPYWLYPDGVYFEQLDTAHNMIMRVTADTVYNYTRTKLIEFKGNVDMLNHEGVHVETSHAFFDQQKDSIYSDVFVRITQGENIRTGTGFRASRDLSKREFRDPGAVFYIDTKRRPIDTDSIPLPDTIPSVLPLDTALSVLPQ